MNSALFLDRDGVVNYSIVRDNKPYAPLNLNELKIIPGIKSVINIFKQRKFKIFVITNQPDVARGKVKKEEIDEINTIVQTQLSIDEVFTCYHDNQDQCDCRKPKSGAFIALSQKYNIDLTKSIMVGDRAKDIEAAKNVNCPSVFIDYGYNELKPLDQNYTIYGTSELLTCLEKHFEHTSIR
jgi:D-glycero-D-manno-heptose 1,7-bisphosphate phosphatase